MDIEELLDIDFHKIANILSQNKKLIIFGGGSAAEYFIKRLSKKWIISYIVDNDLKKHGEKVNDILIKSPELLKKEKKDDICILILSKHGIKISGQLQEYGFLENQHYFNIYEDYEEYFVLYKCISNMNHFLKNINEFPYIDFDKKPTYPQKIGVRTSVDVRENTGEYAIMWYLLLVYNGFNAVLIVDMLENSEFVNVGVDSKIIQRLQNYEIEKLCSLYPKAKVIFMNYDTDTILTDEEVEFAKEQAHITAMWHESRCDKRHLDTDNSIIEESFTRNMLKNLPAIINFLNKNSFNLLLSTDVLEKQGLFTASARKRGIECLTYDGPLVNIKGGIGQGYDVELVLKSNMLSDNLKKYIIKKAKKEFNEMLNGNEINIERCHFQNSVTENITESFDILITLNFEWDATVLGIKSIFKDFYEWFYETLDFILNSTEAKVVVRDHPGKAVFQKFAYRDFKAMLLERYGNNPKLVYISPTEKVSTYSLIKKCKYLITYTSTSGIEGVLLNKNVLLGAETYYSKLGFTYYGKTKEEYFELICKLINQEYKILNKENAYLAFYLIRQMKHQIEFATNRVSWLAQDFSWINNDVQMFLSVIKEKKPVCYLKTIKEYEEMLDESSN